MAYFDSNRVYHYANPVVLDMYRGEERVLDVGCGSGTLAQQLREKKADVVVHGIDGSRTAGDLASGFLESFTCADLDGDVLPSYPHAFDLVIIADVLEHLKHPGRLLIALKRLVSPSGSLVISVPNIAHWSARVRLLRGDFPHEDAGIFDRTHLRFFTRDSLHDFVASSGYEVVEERQVLRPLSLTDPRHLLYAMLFFSLGAWSRMRRSARTRMPTQNIYQFVFRLKPTPAVD